MVLAAGRWVYRAWHLPAQYGSLTLLFKERIGNRHCREQRLGIGVQGVLIERFPVSDLHYVPQVHHGDPGAYVPHHGQVMSNEEIG